MLNVLNGNGGHPYDWAKTASTELLAIERITNDVIELEGGMLAAVLKIEPINLNKLSASKRKDVHDRYLDWINSLTYPVQIAARSVNHDFLARLKIMLNEVEHQIKSNPHKKELLLLFRDFSKWLDENMTENHNRLFFVAIPFTPPSKGMMSLFSSAAAKEKEFFEDCEKLNERVNATVSLLSRTGVTITRMGTNNINELLMSYMILSLQSGAKTNMSFETPLGWFDRFKQTTIEVD